MPVADFAHRCTIYLEQAVSCSHSLSANQKSCPGRVVSLEVWVGEAPEPAAGPEIRPPCESRRKRACSPSARNGRGRWRCVLRGRTAGPAYPPARFPLRRATGHHFERLSLLKAFFLPC